MKRLIMTLASTSLLLSSVGCKDKKTISEVDNDANKEVATAKADLAEDTNDVRDDSDGMFADTPTEQRQDIAELRQETQKEINEIREDAKLEKKDVYLAKLEDQKDYLDKRIDKIVNRIDEDNNKLTVPTADMEKAMHLTAARAGLAKGIDFIKSIDDDRWLSLRDPVRDSYESVLRSLDGFEDSVISH